MNRDRLALDDTRLPPYQYLFKLNEVHTFIVSSTYRDRTVHHHLVCIRLCTCMQMIRCYWSTCIHNRHCCVHIRQYLDRERGGGEGGSEMEEVRGRGGERERGVDRGREREKNTTDDVV